MKNKVFWRKDKPLLSGQCRLDVGKVLREKRQVAPRTQFA
jgi:hypothetical protein